MLRLLHTADWQIGKHFGQFDTDEAALLAEARFGAVERLARLANEQQVDCVLVAGDVFDAQSVADKTIHRLFNLMTAFPGQWVLIPGNHDAGLAESVWTRAQRLGAIPEQVVVCLKPEPLSLGALKLVILPAPLTQRHTYDDLTAWFAEMQTPGDVFRIGLAHGSVQGILADDIDSSNPIAAGRAAQARLDYLALGDWHGTRQIDTHTWYSGTPETDRFRANDSGQSLLVELSAPGASPVVTAVNTGQYRWHTLAFSLNVSSDVDSVLQHIAAFGAADVVQLNLKGQTDLAGFRRLDNALKQASGRVRGLLTDLSALQLAPTADDIEILRADGYLGEVINELRAAQAGPDAGLYRDALSLLVRILDQQAEAGRGRAS